MSYWGYHLILDMSEMNENIKKKDVLEKFIVDVIKSIKMKKVGPTQIKRLENGKPNAGYDVMQFIETSSITLHLVDKDYTGYLDIFSCKEFNPEDALKVVNEYFEPKKIKKKFIYREAPKI